MDERADGFGFETQAADLWALPGELELGSLVAALSALTEDEGELDDRVRCLVESGRFRITVGRGPVAPPLSSALSN